MNRRNKTAAIAASLVAVAAIGAGGGAITYASLADGGTTTVVRQVAVPSGQPAASSSTLSVNQIYQQAYQGVVEITVTSTASSGFAGPQQQQAQGSGWVYDDQGNIVTNQHVVDGASSVSVKFWNGATYKATVVGADASTDLAVIKVDAPASELHPLSLGDSTKLVVGAGVVAIGSPFGLQETVTSGIVSALHRQMNSPNNFTIDDSIQTDAAINHGNSGGPLLNTQGEVVGVNAQIESDSGGNDGVGFAIPSSTVESVVPQLLGGGKVQHAYLGVGVADTQAGGAKVTNVRAGTPADRAGLKNGDLITALGGKTIASGDDLRSAIATHRPGDSVSVTFTRGGAHKIASIKLANRPS